MVPPIPPPSPEDTFRKEYTQAVKQNFKPGMCDAIIKYVQAKLD